MGRPESEFPTIRDLRDRLNELVEKGLGDHPVQAVIVPGSTMRAIERSTGAPENIKPPLMIELTNAVSAGRLPVSLVSTDWLNGLKRTAVQ